MIDLENLLSVKIETPRLLLQPVEMSWAEEISTGFDDDISRYMQALPDRCIEQTHETIRRSRASMAKGKSLHLVALDKGNKGFLGTIGLYNLPSRHPEFGLWIKKEAHGLWYGRECVHNLLDWSVRNLAIDYFVYPVDKRNIPSLKIPEFFNGRVERMYSVRTEGGRTLDILEYHIPLDFK
jgi:RimJ/RimL family protein N-acetyltransferase